MKKTIQAVFLTNIVITILLSGCTSVSPSISSTNLPSPTAMPANTDLITAMGFQFQISKVTVDDAVKMISTDANTAHKGGLVGTSGGVVPVNASGDAVLILYIRLKSGDKQKFLEFEPRITEEGIEKKAIEVITEDNRDGFFWIYDVKRSSHSFFLKLPNNTVLDLQSIIRSAPEGLNP